MTISRASIPDLMWPGLLDTTGRTPVMKHETEADDKNGMIDGGGGDFARGGRSRRRRGGAASGMTVRPRLDRKIRKMPSMKMSGDDALSGALGSPSASSATDSLSSARPKIPRGIGPDAGLSSGIGSSAPSDDSGPADGMPMLKSGGRLKASDRHALPSKDFALSGERYPIDTGNRARNALSRISQFGSSKEKAEVRAAVHRKYPGIGEK